MESVKENDSTKPSAANVELYLKGIHFPATKNKLLKSAENNGAPENVLWLLEQLDEIEYTSPIEVARQIGKFQPATRGGPSAALIERCLKGIKFPTDKATLLNIASKNEASGKILEILEKIEESKYNSVIDISKEIARIQPSPRKRTKKNQNGIGAATIEQYLKGTEFPLGKSALFARAQKNNAPEAILHLLEQFEEKEYKSPIDISKQIGIIKPRRSGKPSAATIEHYLKGIHFEATKKHILSQAQKNNAPEKVMVILQKIEEKKYRSPIDIAKQLSKIEA